MWFKKLEEEKTHNKTGKQKISLGCIIKQTNDWFIIMWLITHHLFVCLYVCDFVNFSLRFIGDIHFSFQNCYTRIFPIYKLHTRYNFCILYPLFWCVFDKHFMMILCYHYENEVYKRCRCNVYLYYDLYFGHIYAVYWQSTGVIHIDGKS